MASTPNSKRLILRQDYFGDPRPGRLLWTCFRIPFPSTSAFRINFGGPDPTSMPFGYFDETGRCVANFSAFSMPLVINGRLVRRRAISRVPCGPEWRGRGLYRDPHAARLRKNQSRGFRARHPADGQARFFTSAMASETFPQHVFRWGAAETAGSCPGAKAPILAGSRRSPPYEERYSKSYSRFPALPPLSGKWRCFTLNACFDPEYPPDFTGCRCGCCRLEVRWWYSSASRCGRCDHSASSCDLHRHSISLPNGSRFCFPLGSGKLDQDWHARALIGASLQLMKLRGQEATDNIDGPIMLSPMAEF